MHDGTERSNEYELMEFFIILTMMNTTMKLIYHVLLLFANVIVGGWFHKDDFQEVSGGEVVCSHCLDRNYTRCDDCSEWHPNDEVRWVNNRRRRVCDSCIEGGEFASCSGCGEWFHYDYMDGGYCEDCKPSLDLDSYGDKFFNTRRLWTEERY